MTSLQKAMLHLCHLCDELHQGIVLNMENPHSKEMASVLEDFGDCGCAHSKIGKAIHEVIREIQDEDDEEATRQREKEQAEREEMRAIFPWHAEGM